MKLRHYDMKNWLRYSECRLNGFMCHYDKAEGVIQSDAQLDKRV